jgi:branched-chain amino acid transport system substrate-binding protein
MFALSGNFNPITDNDDTTYEAEFLKSKGATNIADVGYGAFPSAVAAEKYFAIAAKGLGMKVGLENYSVPVSGMNATSIALAMKSAGVDSMFPVLQTSAALSLLEAAVQTGVNLKVPFLTTGYGQDFLNQPSAVQAGQNAYFLAFQVPIEQKTPATLAEAAALSKYAGYTGDPSINVTFGWLNADLAIAGLEAAGSNPTKASVINAVRNKVTNWNGGGLVAVPRDFTLAHFGQSPAKQCGYFVQLKGTTFVPVPASGTPTCGVKTNG